MTSKRISAMALFVTVASVAATAIVVARGQATSRPGEPTQAHVFVDNRSPSDAVPVVVEALPAPITVRLDSQTAIRTVHAPQNWEYRTVQLSNPSNGSSLGAVGSDGWEAVGIVQTGPNGVTILFKRPR